jgi:hypothetical protein
MDAEVPGISGPDRADGRQAFSIRAMESGLVKNAISAQIATASLSLGNRPHPRIPSEKPAFFIRSHGIFTRGIISAKGGLHE